MPGQGSPSGEGYLVETAGVTVVLLVIAIVFTLIGVLVAILVSSSPALVVLALAGLVSVWARIAQASEHRQATIKAARAAERVRDQRGGMNE